MSNRQTRRRLGSSGHDRPKSPVLPLSRLALGVAVLAALFLAFAHQGDVKTTLAAPSMVTEVNPNTVTPASSLKFGGRIEALAINPVNTQIVLAASELGGLWRSTDGANTWAHVDALPLTRMYDVKFAPADANLVVATGDNDGALPSRGGIWLSTDGGATWSRPATANDDNVCGNPSTPGAHWLDIAGTTPGQLSIFVATDCGISVSTDSGATWANRFASGANNGRYWDVKTAVVGGVIQASACGDGGFTRSTDGAGVTWSAYLGDNSELFGPNALGAPQCHIALAPGDPNTVFISSFKRNAPAPQCGSLLLTSTNANAAAPTWTDLTACPNGDRNGRWPFVQTHPDPANPTTQFLVYFGDNTRITIQTCTYGPTTCAAGPWPYYDGTNPHNGTDPTEVVFDPTIAAGCPAFVSGDGGVYQPSDCSTNPPSWTMMNTSLNALDALNIAGTVYTSPAHTDVYFGTQDDGMFNSSDGGATWNRRAYDIYSLNADHAQTPNSPPSQVFWRDAAYNPPPVNHVNLSNADISSNSVWGSAPPLPPGNNPGDNYAATQFGYNSFAFITPDIAPAKPPAPQPNWAMWVTTNGGGSWTQMGPNAPGAPATFPQASGTAAQPTFYVILSVGGANKLYRLAGPMNSNAVWTDVTSNLSNPTIFAVHPSNPLLLYANDAGLNQVMKSTNGGASWVADTNLTTLAQRGGQFPFANGGSQIAAFGFDGNSNTVMAGANNSGVFASTDGGADWFSVTGAENLPRIAGFFFDERAHSIYFASGGRGMWKIALPTADLSVFKTHTPDPATAGTELYYSITVSNAGPDTAPAVVVTDTLPAQVTFVADTLAAPAGCTANTPPPGTGQTVICNVGDVAAGTSMTFTIKVAVHADAVSAAGGPIAITNTVSVVSPAAIDPNLGNNTAQDTVIVEDLADLAVTKLCKPDTNPLATQPINCTVFVDNYGPSDARGVVVDDVMLSNGTFTVSNVSPALGSGTPGCTLSAVTGGQKLTCRLGTVAAASTSNPGRATITYTISVTEGQDINNTATVRSDTPDPNATNNQALVTLSVTSVADLSLVKTAPSSVVAGTNLTYNLAVTNNGPSTAANVVVKDNMPGQVTIVSVAGSGGASCNAGVPGDPFQPTTCSFGNLAPSASATMTVVVTVKPDTLGPIHNDARASSDTFDDNTNNNLASVTTNVTAQADLGVTKTATPNPVIAGTPLSYQITTTNNGPSTAVNVSVTDPLPAGLTLTSTSVSVAGGSCGLQTNTNTVQCLLGNLDPGQSGVVYIYTNVSPSAPDGSVLANTATVTSDTPDPGPTPNSATATTNVIARADLGITLTSDALVYKPSTTIHYQITVTNAGPSDAQAVVVTMVLPGSKVGYYISNNVGCPPPSGTTFTCSLGAIAAGGTTTFQLNFFIRGNKGTITETATVTSSTTDPNPSNNSSTRVVTVK